MDPRWSYPNGLIRRIAGEISFYTAVLTDRKGRVIGKYRKVYIPREEMECGVTPGTDYPVFDTNLGRIGMIICWDVQYLEPLERGTCNGDDTEPYRHYGAS